MRRSQSVVIAGFGASEITRRSERGITAFSLDAALAALADAKVDRSQIDGYVGAPFSTNADARHAEGGDEISLKTAANALGLKSLAYGVDLYRRYATDMVVSAAHALVAGTCRYVLGLRALYNLPGPPPAVPSAAVAYGGEQFTRPFGYMAAGARFATRARCYMERHGVTRGDLFEVVALSRRHAALNPSAVWRDRPLTREAYLEAPMIASPHSLFDCDMPVCGAAAFVMCLERDLPAGATGAHVVGWGGFATPSNVFEMSGLGRQDVVHCQLYDGFSSMVYEWLETFGFCEEGGAWKFIRDGHGDRDGRLPINTFGGSLGEGRLHGIGHLREAYLQVTGKAGERQLQRAGPALVQVGPFDDSSFVMLRPEAA